MEAVDSAAARSMFGDRREFRAPGCAPIGSVLALCKQAMLMRVSARV